MNCLKTKIRRHHHRPDDFPPGGCRTFWKGAGGVSTAGAGAGDEAVFSVELLFSSGVSPVSVSSASFSSSSVSSFSCSSWSCFFGFCKN